MSLGLYSSASSTTELSTGGDFTSPFALSFDGRVGGSKQVKLYARNSNALYYYENIQIGVNDPEPISITDQVSEGFVWKLIEGDTQPTENDWRNTPAVTAIDLPDIGSSGSPDTSTFLPFWVYIQIPPGLDVQTYDTATFTITADEVLV